MRGYGASMALLSLYSFIGGAVGTSSAENSFALTEIFRQKDARLIDLLSEVRPASFDPIT